MGATYNLKLLWWVKQQELVCVTWKSSIFIECVGHLLYHLLTSILPVYKIVPFLD